LLLPVLLLFSTTKACFIHTSQGIAATTHTISQCFQELEQEKKAAEQEKKKAKKKSFWGFLSRDGKGKDDEEGSLEFSLAGLFKCMCCTHPKNSEEKVQLLRIADSLDKLNRRLDNIER
jgi:chitin synthase